MRGHRHTYVPAFDGLRGIAILPVILLHVGVGTLPDNRLRFELTRGWYGVDLFFVLSGFLITLILLTEMDATGTIDIRRFYIRRCLRLGPAYLSMLLALLGGAAILEPPALSRVPRVLPALVSYTYNYQLAAGGTHLDALVVVWSLCVEEQFYLVWPWVLRSIGARRGLMFCIAAVALLSTYRTGLYLLLNWGHLRQPSPASSIWIYFATDTRIGVILIGCGAALSLRHPRTRRIWRWIRESRSFVPLAAAGVVACVGYVTGGYPSSGSWRSATFGYTLAACASAALIGAIFVQPSSAVTRALSWKPLVSLGRVSYGVYLFHVGIAWLVLWALRPREWPGSPIARFLIAAATVLALTWVVAEIHYRYVEQWFLALRSGRARKAAPSRTAPTRSRRRAAAPIAGAPLTAGK